MKTKRDQQRDMFPCVAADKLIHAAEMTALLSHTRVVRVNCGSTQQQQSENKNKKRRYRQCSFCHRKSKLLRVKQKKRCKGTSRRKTALRHTIALHITSDMKKIGFFFLQLGFKTEVVSKQQQTKFCALAKLKAFPHVKALQKASLPQKRWADEMPWLNVSTKKKKKTKRCIVKYTEQHASLLHWHTQPV